MGVSRADARVAVVGVGGLGAPAALALAKAGVGSLILIDDDVVDRSNLHRQILFRDADVGRPKIDAAIDSLQRRGWRTNVEARRGRLTPQTIDYVDGADVIVECTDNYATKFLAADVARLKNLPIVHGSAIRWIGTALAVGPAGSPCYRCLFEDIPEGAQAGCDVAGVVGPVCGVIGALQAHLALSLLDGPETYGTLISLEGLRDELRVRRISARAGCALCGSGATIDAIDAARYQPTEA
jgi:molybdopterin/thiamine biosynthesis adenylyltransferase